MKRGKRRTVGGDNSSGRGTRRCERQAWGRPVCLRSSGCAVHLERRCVRRWGEGRQEKQVGASHRAGVLH